MKNFSEYPHIIIEEGGKLPPLDEQEGNLGDDEIVKGEEVAPGKGVPTKKSEIEKDEKDIADSYQ